MVLQIKIPSPTLFAAILLFVLVGPASAHNGAVALVHPLTGIEVDGDLSDWPEELPRHPIVRTEHGAPPRDAEDLQADFRVGYADGGRTLYVAVEVRDESVVVTQGGYWNNQDGCEVFVDVRHLRRQSNGRQDGLWGRSARYFWRGPGPLSPARTRRCTAHESGP